MKQTHWKRLWCWERLKAGEEGDDRGWDGWVASPTQWIWVCTNSGDSEGQERLTELDMYSWTWLSDWATTTIPSQNQHKKRCLGHVNWPWRRWHGNPVSLLPIANWPVIHCKGHKEVSFLAGWESFLPKKDRKAIRKKTLISIIDQLSGQANIHTQSFLSFTTMEAP